MNSAISTLLTKTLCDHRGCMDFESLRASIAQRVTVADSILQSVLSDEGKVAIRKGKQKAVGSKYPSPDSLIVAKSSVRLCSTKGCAQCDGLHLCKFWVCGKCRFGNLCKNPHSLKSGHNQSVLMSQGLQDLTEQQLFQLLLQNDPSLLPEVCLHYNKGEGLHGSCKFNTACTKLHICHHYLTGDCKFGASCKRAHDFRINDKKLFQFFSRENVEHLCQTYRNRFIIAAQEERRDDVAHAPQAEVSPALQSPTRKAELPAACKPTSDADRSEICLFFIRRKCSYKEKCARVHWHLPYRWQVLDGDGVTWKDLVKMEEIEQAYCDPGRDNSSMDLPRSSSRSLLDMLTLKRSLIAESPSVDFATMTYKPLASPVRRLSTASSISKPPHFVLTTEWLWYWKDDDGEWQEYGKSNEGRQASITSPTLENLYCADRDGEIPFHAGNQQYILHFKSDPRTQMYQQNIQYKTKREIRRRPRFVSFREVELKLGSPSSHSPASAAESFPPYWDKIDPPDYEYKLISLSTSAKEYDMIEKLFKRTMPSSTINQIQRIQNPSLWKVFQWQKEQMMKKNEGKAVNQLYLFHGTDESLIEAICEQNFDWRMCGVHGTIYGKGSYFARDASYSDQYSRLGSHKRNIMFVALVLVGEYTRGSSRYVRPPPKGNSKTFYDSCVDTESNPSIYVIFEKQQIYPEYLIHYS